MIVKKQTTKLTGSNDTNATTTAPPTTNKNLVVINFKFKTKVKPTKKVLRMYPYNFRQRKCCKQGYKAGKRGYSCDIDRHFQSRVLNMEHRAKMKFQVRPMNRVDRKLIKRIVRFCIKGPVRHKALFKKCCSTAKK